MARAARGRRALARCGRAREYPSCRGGRRGCSALRCAGVRGASQQRNPIPPPFPLPTVAPTRIPTVHSPPPSLAGSHYYSSIPAAMWPTLLNLSGEVPLCDYTPLGKVAALALHLTRSLLGIIERSYRSGRVRHHGRRGSRVLCDPDRDSRRWLPRVGSGQLRELQRRRRRWAGAGRPEHADRSGPAAAAARPPCVKRLDEAYRICNG